MKLYRLLKKLLFLAIAVLLLLGQLGWADPDYLNDSERFSAGIIFEHNTEIRFNILYARFIHTKNMRWIQFKYPIEYQIHTDDVLNNPSLVHCSKDKAKHTLAIYEFNHGNIDYLLGFLNTSQPKLYKHIIYLRQKSFESSNLDLIHELVHAANAELGNIDMSTDELLAQEFEVYYKNHL